MPHEYILGDYISRGSVYALYDKKRCLYVGDTRTGRAGVASRITQHLSNASKEKNLVGKLHEEINDPNKPNNWYLKWRLEIYSISECVKKTNKRLSTVKEAQQAMIEFLKPICNVKKS